MLMPAPTRQRASSTCRRIRSVRLVKRERSADERHGLVVVEPLGEVREPVRGRRELAQAREVRPAQQERPVVLVGKMPTLGREFEREVVRNRARGADDVGWRGGGATSVTPGWYAAEWEVSVSFATKGLVTESAGSSWPMW